MTKQTARSLRELLNPTRVATHHLDDPSLIDGQQRSPFEVDGDKISFTEGFRALADKTQVHDRVSSRGNHRNRLTHSMEVSRVGRSLGVALGARMIGYYGLHASPNGEAFWRVDPTDIGHIVSAACLAHDLGNPPFGHDGEDVISEFFRETRIGQSAVEAAGPEVGAELCLHEGNAQGFRMITRSMGWREEGGLNLTAAVLAAFGKYPFPVRDGSKKYGIHRADLPAMAFVAEATNMQADPKGGWKRHPLAWLMEAADDICYLTVDLEDAVSIGMIALDEVIDLYRPIVGDQAIDTALRMSDQPRMIQYLRSRMIKALITGCVEVYAEIADHIDNATLPKGAFGGGIVGHSRHAAQMDVIRSFSTTRIYKCDETQSARALYRGATRKAMGHLVDELLDMIKQDLGPLDPGSKRFPGLARLPHASLRVSPPKQAAHALPWLIDQITLMSDGQILELSRL
jgi:dGTPase